MTKHRQTRSLGNLSNYAASPKPNPAIETPDTLTEKIESLERRISTLEMILNDVMIQLDKPSKNENQFASKQKPNGKHQSNKNSPKAINKPRRNGKSREQKPPALQRDYKSENLTKAGVPVDIKAVDKASYLAVKKLLSGGAKLTQSAIFEAIPSLGKKSFRRIRTHFSNDENVDREKRLYFSKDKK